MSTETIDTSITYSFARKITHWFVALLMLTIIILGFMMTNLTKDSVYKMPLVLTHKSLGLIALILAPLTVLWIFLRRHTQRYPSSMSVWSILVARIVKLALIAIMLIMPWSGYVMATANGRQVTFFKLFDFPSFINASAANGSMAHAIHLFVAPIAASLIGLHILAALKHHFFDKDNVLRRMLF